MRQLPSLLPSVSSKFRNTQWLTWKLLHDYTGHLWENSKADTGSPQPAIPAILACNPCSAIPAIPAVPALQSLSQTEDTKSEVPPRFLKDQQTPQVSEQMGSNAFCITSGVSSLTTQHELINKLRKLQKSRTIHTWGLVPSSGTVLRTAGRAQVGQNKMLTCPFCTN